jgi:glycosyltransferase involved in cell wall biosynthesis
MTSGAGSAAHGTADFVAYGTTRRAAQVGLQIVNPFATYQAWAAIRSFQPDVALVHLFAYHLSPAVLWPLRSLPTVMMVLDYKVICPLGSKLLPTGEMCAQHAGTICWQAGCLSMPHWLRDSIRYVGIGRAIRQPDLVLACSRHMQRELGAHGIASEALTLPVVEPGPAFERKPSRDPHFVFCGRLSVEKGVPLLVRAFARLHAHIPLARLTIVGDGPLRNEVESAVLARDLHDAVTFTGWLDPAGVERSSKPPGHSSHLPCGPSRWVWSALKLSFAVFPSSPAAWADSPKPSKTRFLVSSFQTATSSRCIARSSKWQPARHFRPTCWIPMLSPARRVRSASNGTS